jgi:hypothetical protein
MPCALCQSVDQNVRNLRIHERLRQIGTTERITRSANRKAAWVTWFCCEVCGTEWRHEDDQNNNRAGWSIARKCVTA